MTRLLLIFCLCATASAQLPPMPPKQYKPAKMIKGAEALIAPKSVVLPPKTTITMSWTHPDPDVTFNVYHSYELPVMKLLTNVATKTFTKKMDQPHEFFCIKAMNKYGLESEWATK